MITIAVANVLESSEQTVEFIYDTSLKEGIKALGISPKDNIIYKNNKRIRLKEYINELKQSKTIDLLLLELNKEGLQKAIYENIKFDIAVLFSPKKHNKKMMNNKAYFNRKILQGIQSDFYIIPDTYQFKRSEYITYGWSKAADISASSAQKNLEGDMNIQCCIQNRMPSFKGEVGTPREFCIHSEGDDVEGMLAGVATMLLYGINIE